MDTRKRHVLAALVASSLLLLPTAAAAPAGAPSPPKKVQISDPAGDANFVNDNSAHQNSAGVAPDLGDQAAPVDASSEADLLSVWFSHDAKTITAHIRTEVAPAGDARVAYFVATNPESFGHWGCLLFVLRMNDPNEAGPRVAYLTDSCGSGDRIDGKSTISEFKDGTGHISITVPRSGSPLLGDGLLVSSPVADARIGIGTPPVTDDTQRGSDYRLTPAR